MTGEYESELAQLDRTFQEAASTRVGTLRSFVESVEDVPLVAIGSGGSYTGAEYLATLHESATGRLGDARTPLSFLTTELTPETCVALVSASGNNKDILRAFDHAKKLGVKDVLILTNDPDSPLATRGRRHDDALVFDLGLSVGQDGYLATNTLLGTVTTVYESYAAAFDRFKQRNWTFEEIVHPGESRTDYVETLEDELATMSDVSTLVVIGGGWSAIGAADAESRLSEAGLKNVQLTDVRNFAHGRQQRLIRHENDSGVLSFVDPEISPITAKTLRGIPDEIPTVELSTRLRGPTAGLAQLVNSMYATRVLGEFDGMDPARPELPDWARELHNLTPAVNRVRPDGR